MLFNLTIYFKSNNSKSLLLHLTAIHTVLDKLYIIKKLVNKSNHSIVFSLLRSPHINKTAQQHFGFRQYKKIIKIIVQNFFKFILWTKVLNNHLFTDISLSIIYTINIKLIFVNSLAVYFNKKLFKFLNFLHFITIKMLLQANNLMV